MGAETVLPCMDDARGNQALRVCAGATGSTYAKPSVRVIDGPALSGKTAALLARLRDLLGAGVSAADVLVVCASRDSAKALARRIRRELRDIKGAHEVRVVSARGLALDVLATASARERIGHGPRVLLDVEWSLVIADLRQRGADPKVLAASLSRLQAQWAKGELPHLGADANADLMTQALRQRGAYHSSELAAHALDCVRAVPELGHACCLAARHVLVDDANALSAAALELTYALADESLLIAGNSQITNRLFDAGAQPAFFLDRAQDWGVEHETLPAPDGGLVRAAEAHVVKSVSPEEETRCTRAYLHHVDMADKQAQAQLAAAMARGEKVDEALGTADDDESVALRNVFVVVPNHAWGAALEESLNDVHVGSVACYERQQIAGDPRKAATAHALQAFALLGIAADHDDVASWRTWMSLGRADCGAAAWAGLVDYARDQGMSVPETLGRLAARGEQALDDAEPFAGAAFVTRRYEQAIAVARRCAGKHGRQLVDVVNALEDSAFAAMCEPVVAQTAGELFVQTMRNVVDRGFANDPWPVRIGCVEATCGLRPPIVVVEGFNDGLCPRTTSRGDSPQASACLRLFSLPTDELLLSYVQRLPEEQARRIGATVKRTRVGHDGPLALLAPSPCLQALGHDVPSTMSSQQYLAVVLNTRA